MAIIRIEEHKEREKNKEMADDIKNTVHDIEMRKRNRSFDHQQDD